MSNDEAEAVLYGLSGGKYIDCVCGGALQVDGENRETRQLKCACGRRWFRIEPPDRSWRKYQLLDRLGRWRATIRSPR